MAKKVERYFYPAVFTYEEGQEIAVTFPDLDAATSGENDDDAPERCGTGGQRAGSAGGRVYARRADGTE